MSKVPPFPVGHGLSSGSAVCWCGRLVHECLEMVAWAAERRHPVNVRDRLAAFVYTLTDWPRHDPDWDAAPPFAVDRCYKVADAAIAFLMLTENEEAS